MLKREQLIKNISDGLAFLELSTRNRGIVRLYDQHIIAETFVANLLNIIYGYNLINLNTIDNTYTATDLGDFSKKLCFQVTYTSKHDSRAKIKDSINKFTNKKMYHEFTCLKFLFLGPKQEKYKKLFDTKNLFSFDPYRDVLNLTDLVKKLPSLSNDELELLTNLISNEFSDNHLANSQIYNQTDLAALKEYRSVFDRPALQDSFHQEGNYKDFELALTELIELLKTGFIRKNFVAKPVDKFDDEKIKLELDYIYHKIRSLRQYYNVYKRSGEIIPENNLAQFKSPGTPDAFNKFKQDIIDRMNSILDKKNIPSIQGVSNSFSATEQYKDI